MISNRNNRKVFYCTCLFLFNILFLFISCLSCLQESKTLGGQAFEELNLHIFRVKAHIFRVNLYVFRVILKLNLHIFRVKAHIFRVNLYVFRVILKLNLHVFRVKTHTFRVILKLNLHIFRVIKSKKHTFFCLCFLLGALYL